MGEVVRIEDYRKPKPKEIKIADLTPEQIQESRQKLIDELKKFGC